MGREEENRWGCVEEGEAEQFREQLPVDEELQDLSEFFKIFGDPTRLRILFLLKQGEFCVHDIAGMLELQQTAVSHQLKLLRQVRLVRYRKEGKHVFYSLSDDHITAILAIGLEHTDE